jgi:flavin reductase (DIM6/NTAB) family NADH-FMN oxidoreductase RutF
MAVSSDEVRMAFSAFPAGVTIVTSANAAGEAFGAAVSAFMSVSLDPPLILVSLNRASKTAAAITAHPHFVVHFVNEATTGLALRFASGSGEGKFDGLRISKTENAVPVLLDCETRLSCSVHAQHDGGDHVLFVGHVEHIEIPESARSRSVAWYERQFCQLVTLPVC